MAIDNPIPKQSIRKHAFPTRARLHELLHWNAVTKQFQWREPGRGKRKDRALHFDSFETPRVRIDGVAYHLKHIQRIYFEEPP